MATVHIGIVTYNSEADLPSCFLSLSQQTYPFLHIVVLDNASEDNSVDWIKQNAQQAEIIVNKHNVGFGGAHNQIIQNCDFDSEDFYMPLNPDVVLESDYIEQLVRGLMETGAGFGSGKLKLLDAQGRDTGLIYSAGQGVRRDGYVINVGEALPDQQQFDISREVFLVSGAAPLLRYSLIQSLAPTGKLFDESMFMYAEDIDLGWRARLYGWRCWYVPSAVGYHRGGKLSPAMRTQALGNIFISTIKNAYLIDLLTYNLPLILLQLIARMCINPRAGMQLVKQVLKVLPGALQKRTPATLPRSEMLHWFQWSEKQPTSQQTRMSIRLLRYLQKKGVYSAIGDKVTAL